MPNESFVALVIDGSSGDADLEEKLAKVMKEYHNLWCIKQLKYGPTNISSMGKPGLVVRLNDKIQRLKRFVLEDIQGDVEGSEEDAWFDVAGYALIGIMVNRGWWPECPPDKVSQEQVNFILRRFCEENSIKKLKVYALKEDENATNES